ncbi:MAG: tRNA dihydrouridine synthase DusB [Nanoarchaeota archaeon]
MKKQFPHLHEKAILSPMAGVTDVAFRALCKYYGAALTCTEFINSTAINRGGRKTMEMLKTDASENPCAIQLFGTNESEVVKAALFVEDDFDIIDINCGCPAWKVIRGGAGSALLETPQKIFDLVQKLNNAVHNPITVKIRIGINEKNINAAAIAQLVERAGAAALAIHGRTQQQGYGGRANWDIIQKVKLAVSIPVIGNGDVFTPENFKEKLEYSGVDYIMIARGAMGNPYIFKQINDYLSTGKFDEKDVIEQFFEYLALARKHCITFSQIKNQAVMFTKGVVGGAELRQKLTRCKNEDELTELLENYREF